MSALISIEFSKLWRLASLRFSLILLALFPVVWAYAPGVYDVYGVFVMSAYQVPGLALLSSMEFLLPLLVAIASAELLGLDISLGTLPTVLLRPIARTNWLVAKLAVSIAYPFILLAFLLIVGLLVGFPYGYGSFLGGTGVESGGLVGQGVLEPRAALTELLRAYLIAGYSLVPVSLLAVLFTVVFMNAAGGALATLAALVFMRQLDVLPDVVERFLLTSQLSAYAVAPNGLVWALLTILAYTALFASLSVKLFEKKDF